MKLLYFTTANNAENYEKIQKNSRIKASVATQVFETALLRGMAKQRDLDLTLRSFPMIASFPGSRLLFWGSKKEAVADFFETRWLPTINLYGLKQWSQKISAKRAVKQWLRDNKNESEKAILLYSVYEPIAVPVQNHCRKHGCRCFAIVPDLPRDMYKALSGNPVKAFFQKRYMKKAVRCQSGFDGYVYLTDAMSEVVSPSAPYTVIEGIADLNAKPDTVSVLKTEKRVIMYAGAINMQYGIRNLIEAFSALPFADTELWIFGAGIDAAEVAEISAKKDNIRFFGRRSREEILAYEKEAAILVNVRDPNDAFTKYSFPSKTIEYMLSGTPLLTTHLPGIPAEYFPYVYIIEDNSSETIRTKLEQLLSADAAELREKGMLAKSFVSESKNSEKQADRLCKFLQENL